MELIEYVKDYKGKPIGCVVAVDRGKIGWSVCHTKDNFNKEMGRKIALDRANKNVLYNRYVSRNSSYDMDSYIDYLIEKTKKPEMYKTHKVSKTMKKMNERAKKYYKE